ncbi:hypothetical protein B0H16DRAFT_433264 [Mycena metata]|uniref:Uncharacterized protein n=1 Tax=Mycena metata TaxID=1033252 RepID=A0AAD7HE19_9AGAR|nr:hypothetical protein B0H16DRAFT_433264 [Mycena metata]
MLPTYLPSLAGPSLLTVNMCTVVLESLFYGILLVCVCATLYLRFARHKKITGDRTPIWRTRRVWWNPVVIPTVAIFATCSAHWILTVVDFFEAFRSRDNAVALLFYSNGSRSTQVARSVLSELAVLIGDAVIIYRLWLIGNRNIYIVLIPVICWVGVLVCGTAVAVLFSQSNLEQDPFRTSAGNWVTGNWVLTAVTNLYCTALIAWKVWRTNRVMEGLGNGVLMHALAILIESAGLWAAWTIFFAVSYQTHLTLRPIVTDLKATTVGLVNIFIHLRVEFGWSSTRESDAAASGGVMTSTASIFALSLPLTDSYYLEGISSNPQTVGK